MESINYKNKGKVDIKFPFVSDVGLEISKMYGMIHPNSSKTKDIRAVFIINPEDKISAILYYPNEIGRNIDEIMRTLDALQKVYKKDILTPANWNEGDNILLASPKSQEEARKLATKNNASLKSYAWYLWFEKQ
jgi:peroxiredoxin (alkyl hydroperoxide reductase subunit C)